MKFIEEIKRRFGAAVYIRDEQVVDTKICQLVEGGVEKLQIISDFDRTISTSVHNNEPTKSSFCVFESCSSLTEDYKQKARELYNKFLPIEDDPNMTVAEKLPYIEDWWRQSERLLKNMRFRYEDIELAVKQADVKLREGSAEVFQKLYKHNVPVIVLSAGIGDVVELTLIHENLLTANVSVVSNFLDIADADDGSTVIKGFKGSKLIHVFNKNEHAYLESHSNDTKLSGRLNVILMGDSLGDANMDGGIAYDTVLRIGFLNSDVETKDDPYLLQYERAFDIVLVQDQTMGAFDYLLEEIINNR
ncbi:cytosolic 5'-nucleotidase 3 [Adelges cooleyi]|uniref:cytosolic 5'-nucleotidase 3 n=1 Tax=Adelges cooleyi TaxID=133065 RepID=UPI00217FA375|nr:cytosolic 5'-nucleotidase 3 [Adelges cooleyi]XP_050426852.1 cytosolic 5'-nucleotidase 3 [Adelges cooleyi]XP_050426854.1 cytosolic 5'-nucleotidase 3 [Adelges cooleyi]